MKILENSVSDSVYQEQVNSYVDKGLASQSCSRFCICINVVVLNIVRVIIQYWNTIARQKKFMLAILWIIQF
jgi:hypothetical protein